MRKLYFTAALIALAATQGCQGVNSVERAVPLSTPNRIADKRVITDATLAASIALLDVSQTLVSGNLLKIQIQLESLTGSTTHCRYRVQWIDRDGMMIDSPIDSWKPLTVQGKERSTISAVATNPNAVDFIIKFQEI